MLIQVGCATPSFQLRSPVMDHTEWDGTAILLHYDLDTRDPDALSEGCSLNLKREHSDRIYSIHLPGRSHFVLVSAPGGTYEAQTLECPRFSKWQLEAFPKRPATLVEGKINYWGSVAFHFSPNGSTSLDLARGDQKSATLALIDDLQVLPKAWRTALVNPFTARPIAPEMLLKKELYSMETHFSWLLKKGETASSTADLQAQLGSCDVADQKALPYRIGILKITAIYENRKLRSLKTDDRSSFSQSFLGCLEHALREYRPASDDRLTAVVSL
jgi:hypothetical protein